MSFLKEALHRINNEDNPFIKPLTTPKTHNTPKTSTNIDNVPPRKNEQPKTTATHHVHYNDLLKERAKKRYSEWSKLDVEKEDAK